MPPHSHAQNTSASAAAAAAAVAAAAQQAGSAASEVVLATAGYDHTIRFWEALSGICIRTIQHPDSQVNRLTISSDKRFLASAGNPHVRLYDVQSSNPNPISSFDGHSGNVTAIAFQAANRWLVTGNEDGSIKIWDVRAPGVQREYDLKTPVHDVIIHPNQGELISADQSGAVRVWDLGQNACTHALIPEDDVPVRSVTMASDGSMLVAANNRGNFYTWRTRGRAGPLGPDVAPLAKTNAHAKYITKALLSPDTRMLATCSADHTVRMWNTHAHLLYGSASASGNPHAPGTGATASGSTGGGGSRPSSSGGPTGEGSSSSNTNGGEHRFTLERVLGEHSRWVWDCAFSADSAYLVTASSDHKARLWDVGASEPIRVYQGHTKAVVCVALHDISL